MSPQITANGNVWYHKISTFCKTKASPKRKIAGNTCVDLEPGRTRKKEMGREWVRACVDENVDAMDILVEARIERRKGEQRRSRCNSDILLRNLCMWR